MLASTSVVCPSIRKSKSTAQSVDAVSGRKRPSAYTPAIRAKIATAIAPRIATGLTRAHRSHDLAGSSAANQLNKATADNPAPTQNQAGPSAESRRRLSTIVLTHAIRNATAARLIARKAARVTGSSTGPRKSSPTDLRKDSHPKITAAIADVEKTAANVR